MKFTLFLFYSICQCFIKKSKTVNIVIMNRKIALTTLFFLSVFALSAQEARYGIKSAIIKKTSEVMGGKVEQIQYIDDYGAKEAHVSDTALKIIKENTDIDIMLKSKTGTKRVIPKDRLNFMKLTPEMIRKNELKKEGEEEVAGKMCDKYAMTIDVMGRKAPSTVWIWKGVVMKRVVPSVGLTELVTEIQENVAVKAEVFLVPDDVTIQ